MKALFRVTCLLLLVILGACAQIPQAEFGAFVAAVGEAKESGKTLTLDWESAVAEFNRREAVLAKKGGEDKGTATPFLDLDPIAANPTNKMGSSEARLLAWDAIDAYIDALTRLAAGQGVDEVKGTAGRLFDIGLKISGTTLPGGSALSSVLQSVAGEIEKIRQSREFKKAIRRAAPVLQKIISDVFIPDTKDHYGLRRVLAAEDYAEIKFLSKLSKDKRALKLKRLEDEIEALRLSLIDYRRMLQKLTNSISLLVASVNKPPDFNLEASRVLDLAFVVRKHFRAYENARKEARN